MQKIGKLASILAASASAIMAVSSSAVAAPVDPPPLLDVLDDVNLVNNSNLLPVGVLPGLSLVCFATANNNVKGNNNTTNQSVTCSQNAQQTLPPPSQNGALREYQVVQADRIALQAEEISGEQVIECPSGKVALAAGYRAIDYALGPGEIISALTSAPSPGNTGWRFQFKNMSDTPAAVDPYVVCARQS